MKNRSCIIAVLGVVFLGIAGSATAAPILRLEQEGGATLTLEDLDHDGFVSYAGTFGGFALNTSWGFSEPYSPTTNVALLDLFSMTLSYSAASTPATLKITLADTDFSLPVGNGAGARAQADVGGTLFGQPGSSVSFQSWLNMENLSPLSNAATTIPDDSLALFAPTAALFTTSSFSRTNSVDLTYSGPFSMFSQAIITMNGPGFVAFNQNALATVPEPATLGLLGLGLVSLAGYARRGRRKLATSH